MTSTIAWNLIASYYDGIAFDRDGLMTAMEPWSGHYTVNSPIWVSAHTTQFTEIGWKYLIHKSGVGHLNHGGSYVSFTDPNNHQLTIVIETMSRNHSECIRPYLPPYTVADQYAQFSLAGSFSHITELDLWYTELGYNGDPSVLFRNRGTIKVVNGKFLLHLPVDNIFTLTTVRDDHHGFYATPPTSEPFVLPYSDTFEDYREFEEPNLLAQQNGAWEIITEPNNKFARQTVLHPPVHWCQNKALGPLAVIGSQNWTDIQIQAKLRIPNVNGSSTIVLGARVTFSGCEPSKATGIFLWFHKNSTSFCLTTDIQALHVFDLGNLKEAFFTDRWYSAGLKVTKSYVEARLNDEIIAQQDIPSSMVKAKELFNEYIIDRNLKNSLNKLKHFN